MKKHTRSDKLSRELQGEARSRRPAFSAELHDRILAALPEQAPPRDRPRQHPRPAGWSMVAAAVILVAAVGLWGLHEIWQLRPTQDNRVQWVAGSAIEAPGPVANVEAPPHQPVDPVESEATLALFELAIEPLRAVGQAETAVPTALMDEQLAMLDHDARIAAAWVLDPLTALSFED